MSAPFTATVMGVSNGGWKIRRNSSRTPDERVATSLERAASTIEAALTRRDKG
jgi:hypothetical protein